VLVQKQLGIFAKTIRILKNVKLLKVRSVDNGKKIEMLEEKLWEK